MASILSALTRSLSNHVPRFSKSDVFKLKTPITINYGMQVTTLSKLGNLVCYYLVELKQR